MYKYERFFGNANRYVLLYFALLIVSLYLLTLALRAVVTVMLILVGLDWGVETVYCMLFRLSA